MADGAMRDDGKTFIFRRCITLRNGTRICKPKGRRFGFP